MKAYSLCRLDSLPGLGTRGFRIQVDGRGMVVIAVYWHGQLTGYLNACPHTGVELNWLEDQFFDSDAIFLQCGMHGALFRPGDGYCVHGPCVGRTLIRLEVAMYEGVLHVRV